MRRFSLIGRLGPDDIASVKPVQTDSDIYEIDFLDSDLRMGFGIGQALDQVASLGLRSSERAIDLVLLAALVTAGDTRVSRQINAQDGWTREVDLYVPVSAPRVWNDQRQRIEALLRFLTGDRWRVFFHARSDRTMALAIQPRRVAIGGLTDVSLLSGGLDSLIAAIDLLARGRRPLFVSHYWDAETAKAQTCVLRALEKHFRRTEFKSVRVRLGFDRHHLDTREREATQRSRSFLFYALAALAASAFDRPTAVGVPENGLIALNVPLDPLRLGALSTRTAHPHVIAGIRLLSDAVGLSVSFSNPYRHMTKGEMVSGCADGSFLRKVVGDSMSCSSPAKARYRKLSPRHCGYCVPCLIRRASLKAGLGVKDPTLYTVENLRAQTLATDRVEGEHVRSFQLMVKRIKAAPGLAKVLVHKPGPLIDAPEEIPAYADVFRRGVLEVGELLQGVKARPGRWS
ncbi:Qat anti-phage system QueC-like protein QatC [Candidatus Palauibacter irciniicola]|uniref:Qat anti-phage system QueC-like protein QatC n=1 Tax=Candidatus Palauibacter irciniicola TaxID=3056733 RepID=UPI003B01D0E1